MDDYVKAPHSCGRNPEVVTCDVGGPLVESCNILSCDPVAHLIMFAPVRKIWASYIF